MSFSMAWKVCLWAHLLDGERAHRLLQNLLSKGTWPSMFSKDGRALQVDGNLGGSAGINEMLLQSTRGEIRLLPALPAAWPTGFVRGCGRVEGSRWISSGKTEHSSAAEYAHCREINAGSATGILWASFQRAEIKSWNSTSS